MDNSEDSISRITAYKLVGVDIAACTVPEFELIKKDSGELAGKAYRYLLFLHNDGPIQPPWVKVFAHLSFDGIKVTWPHTFVTGFVLIVEINGSVYAVTGGVGHSYVRSNFKIERRFGIELGLRILTVPELRGLSQKDTGGVVNSYDRIFRGVYNPKSDLANLKRVLKNLRGTLNSKQSEFIKLGKSIQAGDSITVNGSKNFEGILTFLVQIDALMKNSQPTLAIPQLENINPKDNADLLEELEVQLVGELMTYDPNAPPSLFLDNEDIGYLPDRVIKYWLCKGREIQEAATYEDVLRLAGEKLKAEPNNAARLEAFRALKMRVQFDDHQLEAQRLTYFLCGDLTYQNNVYFLNNDLWYRASQEFLDSINRELANIEYVVPEALGLQMWDDPKHEPEGKYNARNKSLIVLDRHLVKITDEKGGIEFCDLLYAADSKTNLIHVKHASGAALRALFAQGFVSAKLYAESEEFRTKVYTADLSSKDGIIPEKVKKSMAKLKGIQRYGMRVIFAIADSTRSHKVGEGAKTVEHILGKTLTTFARVDLLDRVAAIRSLGFDVALTRIKPYTK